MSETGFHFPIDAQHTKANNEYYRDTRRLLVSSAVFSALLLVGAVVVFIAFDHTALVIAAGLILLALSALYVAVTFQVKRAIKDPQTLYDESPLAPAMIAEVDERTMVLMTLVDTRKDTTVGDPVRALAIRTVTAISGVPRSVGARVPVVAVAGSHKDRTQFYDEITPVPIAWATTDKTVIAQATRAIADADWELLRGNLSRVDDIRATKHDLLPMK